MVKHPRIGPGFTPVTVPQSSGAIASYINPTGPNGCEASYIVANVGAIPFRGRAIGDLPAGAE